MTRALHLCTLCPWIRKCINTWSYNYPVKHNSQNSQDWVWAWVFCSLQGNRKSEKPKCPVWCQVLSWASCRHAVPSLVLGLSCLAGRISDLLCHCQCAYPWSMSAPLFCQSLGKQRHAAEGNALLALLLPQLLDPCHLRRSSALTSLTWRSQAVLLLFLILGSALAYQMLRKWVFDQYYRHNRALANGFKMFSHYWQRLIIGFHNLYLHLLIRQYKLK